MTMDRVRAMCELDVATARAMSPPTDISDDMVLAGLHKSRCEMVHTIEEITEEMARESIEWLADRGMSPGIKEVRI